MRAQLLVALLLAAACTAGQGATLQRAARLQLAAPPPLPPPLGAAAAAAAWRANSEPPPAPWWARWLPPALRTHQRQRTVVVAPRRSDGRAAPPVELCLPQSQIEAEGLQPLTPEQQQEEEQERGRGGRSLDPDSSSRSSSSSSSSSSSNTNSSSSSSGEAAGWWPWHHTKPTAFNDSALTPLVPLWLSWMVDSEAQVQAAQQSGLDFELARTISSYVAVAYCNSTNIMPWNCTRCNGPAGGFETERLQFDPLWDLLGFVGYSAPLDAIVVVFRGTDSHSIYNWVENMRTWRTDLAISYPGMPPHALVHGGFFWSYNASSLAGNVTAAVRHLREQHPNSPVYVSGHSLGGALATICALDLRTNLGIEDVRLYTFGSPRVGNWVFAKWFEKMIKVHWRFTHSRDIVPSVPPYYMGFYHLSREVWVVDGMVDASAHTLVGICDDTGEDSRCHNSVCHLGLCSSVSDHLLYLSEMYAPHPYGC